MLFGCKTIPSDIAIYLGREKLRWVDSFRHLGNIFTPDLKDGLHIQLERDNFFRSVNGMCVKFKSVFISNDVASKLFQTYCCSFMAVSCGTYQAHLSVTYVPHGIKLYAGYFICYHSPHTDFYFRVWPSQIIYETISPRDPWHFFQNMMLSDDEVIKFLSVNAYFCNSLVGINRKFFITYKKKKIEWIGGKPHWSIVVST